MCTCSNLSLWVISVPKSREASSTLLTVGALDCSACCVKRVGVHVTVCFIKCFLIKIRIIQVLYYKLSVERLTVTIRVFALAMLACSGK